MARNLGTLTIDVIAEVGGFVAGMDKAERSAAAWRKSVEKNVRAASTALGAGLSAGIAGFNTVLALIVKNTSDAEKEVGQLDAILKSTGNAAGFTRQQLLDMADVLSSKSTFSAGEIVDAQTRLLSYSGVLGTNIPRAMQAIIDQSARLGISVSQSAETIGRALESPAKAAAALAQSGFGAAFTKEVRGTIDELVKAGKEGEAQIMILEILEESYAGAAEAARNTFAGALKGLQNALNDLTTAKDGSLQAATDSVNDLVKTIQDPSTKKAFDDLLSYAVETAAGFARLVSSTGAALTQFLQLRDLRAGGSLSDAADSTLDARMVEITKLIAAERRASAIYGRNEKAEEERSKRINDLIAERTRLQRELTERIKQGQVAENFKGVTSSVDSTGKLVTPESIRAEAAALAETAKAREAAAKKQAAAAAAVQRSYESSIIDYERLIALTITDAKRTAEVTEVEKARFEISSGKYKDYSAAQQKVILAKAEELDKTLKLKKANEEMAKVAEYTANLQAELSNARNSLDVDFVGAGQGAMARERARLLLGIETEYQKKREDLLKQYQAGDITQSLYDKETAALDEALKKRLEIQKEYFSKSDDQRADFLAGSSDAWRNFADEATNYSQQAYEATSELLNGTTNAISENIQELIKGNQSVFESVKNIAVSVGETVIDTISKMAAQWLVYQAVQKLVGESTSQSSSSALISNAAALSAQAAIAAYASTAAIPITGPLAAPAAASAAIAATAPYVAAVVASSSVKGMAHDGIDSVPETGTWLLQKGERVTTASTSAKLDATLDRVNRDTERPTGGDTFEMAFNVNGSISDRERMMQQETVRLAVIRAKSEVEGDMASGRGISKVMRGTHTVKRTAR